MKQIHRAYSKRDDLWWCSIDGEHWLGFTREPQATTDDYESIAATFSGNDRFVPMTVHRSALAWESMGRPTILEPLTIGTEG